MQRLIGVLTLLILLGAGAALADLPDWESRLDLAGSTAQDQTQGWRRTAHGWEHISAWRYASPATPWVVEQVSPLTLLLAQISVVTALLAAQRSGGEVG